MVMQSDPSGFPGVSQHTVRANHCAATRAGLGYEGAPQQVRARPVGSKARPPDLFVTKLAQHIWRRTQGFVGETTRLVARSVLDAVHDRRSVITHDDLDAVDLSDRSIDGQIDAATAARKGRR